jgi:hypothetical protein
VFYHFYFKNLNTYEGTPKFELPVSIIAANDFSYPTFWHSSLLYLILLPSRAHYLTDYVQYGLYAIVCIYLRPFKPPTICSGLIPPKIAYDYSSLFGPAILKLTIALSMYPFFFKVQT